MHVIWLMYVCEGVHRNYGSLVCLYSIRGRAERRVDSRTRRSSGRSVHSPCHRCYHLHLQTVLLQRRRNHRQGERIWIHDSCSSSSVCWESRFCCKVSYGLQWWVYNALIAYIMFFVWKLDAGHSIERKLTPATWSPSIRFCTLWPCDLTVEFDLLTQY